LPLNHGQIYAIGVGGTGAKCLEACSHLASIGMFGVQELNFLFVDADETNGSVNRAKACISTIQKCRETVCGGDKSMSWLKSPISELGLWSPFNGDSTTLGSYFNYNSLKVENSDLASLFDVLYTKEEQAADLDIGFRGRPAIGSAILSQINLDSISDEPWASLWNRIKSNVSQGTRPKILLYGSIFGGTGAAGIPTIGRLLSKKLESEGLRNAVSLGAVLMLPYFGFVPPSGEDSLPNDEILASSDQFLLNTEGALKYYAEQGEDIFDTAYLLGNHPFEKVNEFSGGKKKQRNSQHFLELYAAMAGVHFQRSDAAPGKSSEAFVISRSQKGKISWPDLPLQEEIRKNIVNGSRFAYVWMTHVCPDLRRARREKDFAYTSSWLVPFYKSEPGLFSSVFGTRGEHLPEIGSPEDNQNIAIISSWCSSFWDWLLCIHSTEKDTIELLDLQILKQVHSSRGEDILWEDKLCDLDMNDSRSERIRGKDRITEYLDESKLSSQLTSPATYGAVGLACSLYKLLQL
jgi:hypothetical protein